MNQLEVQNLPLSFRAFQIMNSLRLAQLLGDTQALPGGGWADPFNDESDVDVLATSYSNPLGSGNRTGQITVTFNTLTIEQTGTPDNLVDGGTTDNNTDALYFANGQTTGSIQFDLGAAYVINELKWIQSSTTAHGTWKLQGSNTTGGASGYVDIGTSFALGGASTVTVTAISANTTAYRYYRLTMVSGSTSNANRILEIEFKIAAAGTGLSTNQVYNATTDLYSPAPQAVSLSGGTILTNFDLRSTAAFDGVTSQAAASATTENNNPAVSAYIGKTLSSPSRVTSAIVYGSNDIGFCGTVSASLTNVTITLYGKQGTAPASGTDGTALGSITFTNTANESSGRTITSSDTQTIWDHAWVNITQSQNINLHLAELQLFSRSNMTLQSVAKTALAQKDQALVVLQATPNEAITLNTDLIASVARDTGADFAAVTLSQLADGWYYGLADLRSKPAGTTMRLKAQTANGKNIDISGWAMDLAA